MIYQIYASWNCPITRMLLSNIRHEVAITRHHTKYVRPLHWQKKSYLVADVAFVHHRPRPQWIMTGALQSLFLFGLGVVRRHILIYRFYGPSYISHLPLTHFASIDPPPSHFPPHPTLWSGIIQLIRFGRRDNAIMASSLPDGRSLFPFTPWIVFRRETEASKSS